MDSTKNLQQKNWFNENVEQKESDKKRWKHSRTKIYEQNLRQNHFLNEYLSSVHLVIVVIISFTTLRCEFRSHLPRFRPKLPILLIA